MTPTDLKDRSLLAKIGLGRQSAGSEAVSSLGDARACLEKPVVSEAERASWLKEAAYFKEAGSAVDFEKTIEDMFGIIQSMESKLTHVLNVNALLERDMNNSKERIANLKMERDRLRELLAKRDEEIPTARELQMVIDSLIEERNEAEQRIRDLTRRNSEIGQNMVQAENKIADLNNERKDLILEINVIESRLNSCLEAARQSEERLAGIETQSEADKRKIKDLEADLQLVLDDKFNTSKALKDALRTVAELQAKLG